MREQVSVSRRPGRDRCPYCYDLADEGGACVTCPGCATRVHEECARELRRCPTLGCRERLLGLGRRDETTPPLRPRVCPECGDRIPGVAGFHIRICPCGVRHTAGCLREGHPCRVCGRDPVQRSVRRRWGWLAGLVAAVLFLLIVPALVAGGRGGSARPPRFDPRVPSQSWPEQADGQWFGTLPRGDVLPIRERATVATLPAGQERTLEIVVPADKAGCVVTLTGEGAQAQARYMPEHVVRTVRTPAGVGLWIPGGGAVRKVAVSCRGPGELRVQIGALSTAAQRLTVSDAPQHLLLMGDLLPPQGP